MTVKQIMSLINKTNREISQYTNYHPLSLSEQELHTRMQRYLLEAYSSLSMLEKSVEEFKNISDDMPSTLVNIYESDLNSAERVYPIEISTEGTNRA